MANAGRLILKLKKRAREAGTAWERRELLQRARDIAASAAKAEYREKVALLRGDMAGAF